MHVIEGNFGKKDQDQPQEEEVMTVAQLLKEAQLDDVLPDACIIIFEKGNHVYTLTTPQLSVIEIMGAFERHKFMMHMSVLANGEDY